jgi:LysM repeat protein
MKTIYKSIFILAILFSLILVGCTRSASKAPASVSEEGDTTSQTEVTKAPIDILGEKATQTAMAESGGEKQVEAESVEGETVTEAEGAEEESTEASSAESETAAEAETSPETAPDTETVAEPVVEPDDFGVPNKYEVKSGDHPYCIARRFDIDVAAFFSANGLSNESLLYPGTVLAIPKDAGSFGGQRMLISHPTNYTVQAGDTLNLIACKFGDVDPRAIAAVNGFDENDTLTVGDVIKIP